MSTSVQHQTSPSSHDVMPMEFLSSGDSFRNAENTRRGELLNLTSSMKVLVVDHKKDFLAYVAHVLHSSSFDVTCVHHPGVALRLLTEKKIEFDLLLIDSDMTDVDVHTFLRLTKDMNLLSIVMSEQEDDDTLLLEAFKNGAHLVLKRPLTFNVVMRIRQDIIRKRMRKNEKFHNFNNHVAYQSSEGDYDDDESLKKKICVKWTQELHEKFLNAINHLGEGSCYPKEILNLMGVPGLTRMQVASHLQKHRKQAKKANEKRRTPTSSSNLTRLRVFQGRYGRMPSLRIDQDVQDLHPFSSNPKQTSDDFPDFLKDLNGNIGPNENLIPGSFSLGYNHVMRNEGTTGGNQNI